LRGFLLVLEEIEGRLKAAICESLEGRLKATICDSLEGRLKATIVIFNHIGKLKRYALGAHFSFLFCFFFKCMCCKLVSSPTLSHFSSIILWQVATYYQGPRFNIHDVDVNVVCLFGSIFYYNDGGGRFT
jgi:hypothetical protein